MDRNAVTIQCSQVNGPEENINCFDSLNFSVIQDNVIFIVIFYSIHK
jgi:hypothetical protein